jgi:hypothetical protein
VLGQGRSGRGSWTRRTGRRASRSTARDQKKRSTQRISERGIATRDDGDEHTAVDKIDPHGRRQKDLKARAAGDWSRRLDILQSRAVPGCARKQEARPADKKLRAQEKSKHRDWLERKSTARGIAMVRYFSFWIFFSLFFKEFSDISRINIYSDK